MEKLFSAILAALGMKAAKAGSQACIMLVFDEEPSPRSLIK